ncbi:MAG TPA: c-type cytochrome [Candidatus Acidoferrum sp.]|nr:c-type cytochrome [Candidatus Acidoferrum sp.]
MNPISRRLFARIAVLLAFTFSTAFLFTAIAQDQNAKPKTAVQQFKNIQVLKDIPADQLVPTMQFIAGALGVDCEFCHVEHAMDKDDKKEKQTARKMMAMELTINADQFEGHIEVTCYTCHRGSPHPVGIPILTADAGKMEPHEHREISAQEGLPSTDQILDKYLGAVGGADALHKIKTRIQKGTIEAMGQQYPVEIYSESPEKRVSISHPSFGDSVTAFNGQIGWLTTPRGVRPMSAQEGQAARIDAQLYLPTRLRELYQEFHVLPGESIDGHATFLVTAQGAGTPPLRLYFDRQTGLLLRLVRYAETPLGRNPTQVDYADYRDTAGVKIPYQWTLTRTNGSFTIRINSVQQNVPVDEKLFVMPPAPETPHP